MLSRLPYIAAGSEYVYGNNISAITGSFGFPGAGPNGGWGWPDLVIVDNRGEVTHYEIKPDTPSGRDEGRRQTERYQRACETQYAVCRQGDSYGNRTIDLGIATLNVRQGERGLIYYDKLDFRRLGVATVIAALRDVLQQLQDSLRRRPIPRPA